MRIVIIIAIALIIIYLIIFYDKYQRVQQEKTTVVLNKTDAIMPSKNTKTRQSVKNHPPQINSSIKQLDIESEFAPPLETTASEKLWTLALLMSLEWKRYEELCKEWLIIHKQKAQLTSIGADGGIDITITDNQQRIIAIAQCKAWQQKVGVNLLREFYGIMASEQIRKGIYFTTSDFTQDAILFSNNKNIELINGKGLLKNILSLTEKQQQHLYQLATEGDYTTPTCPSCNIKMLKRSSEKGEFWGCYYYPKCKTILNIRKTLF